MAKKVEGPDVKNVFKENITTILAILVVLFVFLIGNHIGIFIEESFEKHDNPLTAISNVISSFFSLKDWIRTGFLTPSFNLIPIICGLAMIAGVILSVLYSQNKRENKRLGVEHGSARYGDVKKEAYPLQNKEDPKYAIIYSEGISVSMDTRKTFLNNNTLTIGGSGSGKTRFHVKPDILNFACNYIVTDPKDSLVKDVGTAFLKEGYDMKYLNLVNFATSMHFNPFKYIYKPNDVLKFVNNLVSSTTKNAKAAGGDEFFEKAEIALSTAIVFLIFACTPDSPEDRNMDEFMDLLDMAEASEDDENMESDLDIMFQELEKENQEKLKLKLITKREYKNSWDYLAIRQYNLYKKAAGKTAKSILISIGVRMAVFNLPELSDLLKYDELDLETIGSPKPQPKYDDNHNQMLLEGKKVFLSKNKEDCYQWIDSNGDIRYKRFSDHQFVEVDLQKTILFVAISDSDSTFNFLAAILYQQLFDLLYRQADANPDGKLPIHTRFVLDEFANTGKITDFEIKIATMRSREISVDVILQNLAQLKNLYKESWETIEGNCDVTLFLGGKEYSTLERLSKIIGNTTINYLSTTENKGGSNSGSWSKSVQLISVPLLAPDEIGRLATDECLIHIRGQHIFRDKKFDLMKHDNITYTKDADKKYAFDTTLFEKYFTDPDILIPYEEEFEDFDEFEGDTSLIYNSYKFDISSDFSNKLLTE